MRWFQPTGRQVRQLRLLGIGGAAVATTAGIINGDWIWAALIALLGIYLGVLTVREW